NPVQPPPDSGATCTGLRPPGACCDTDRATGRSHRIGDGGIAPRSSGLVPHRPVSSSASETHAGAGCTPGPTSWPMRRAAMTTGSDSPLAVVGGRLLTGLVDVTSDLAALDGSGL